MFVFESKNVAIVLYDPGFAVVFLDTLNPPLAFNKLGIVTSPVVFEIERRLAPLVTS